MCHNNYNLHHKCNYHNHNHNLHHEHDYHSLKHQHQHKHKYNYEHKYERFEGEYDHLQMRIWWCLLYCDRLYWWRGSQWKPNQGLWWKLLLLERRWTLPNRLRCVSDGMKRGTD